MGHKKPMRINHVAVMCGSYHSPFSFTCVLPEEKKTLGAWLSRRLLFACGHVSSVARRGKERRHIRRRGIGACNSREGRESGEVEGPVR